MRSGVQRCTSANGVWVTGETANGGSEEKDANGGSGGEGKEFAL